MRYIVVSAFFVDSGEFNGVADNGVAVRELAQAMVKGDADFPEDVQLAVIQAPPSALPNEHFHQIDPNDWLLGEVMFFARRLTTH